MLSFIHLRLDIFVVITLFKNRIIHMLAHIFHMVYMYLGRTSNLFLNKILILQKIAIKTMFKLNETSKILLIGLGI